MPATSIEGTPDALGGCLAVTPFQLSVDLVSRWRGCGSMKQFRNRDATNFWLARNRLETGTTYQCRDPTLGAA
jgi:hypothetical protein